MKSVQLSQNFLQNHRTAKRLVYIADGPQDALWVDLGAGKGVITHVVASRGYEVVAIEKDPRLVRHLRERFADSPNVTVQEADLLTVPLPDRPFVCVGNPPFNLSTQLVRRWFTPEGITSGALIAERAFAGRLASVYGTTKLSASLGALFEVTVPARLHAAEFLPRPRVEVAILRIARLSEPLVSWDDREAYWAFVNYVFERGCYTLGKSLGDIGLRNIDGALQRLPMRETPVEVLASLFRELRSDRSRASWDRIDRFNRSLARNRWPLTPQR